MAGFNFKSKAAAKTPTPQGSDAPAFSVPTPQPYQGSPYVKSPEVAGEKSIKIPEFLQKTSRIAKDYTTRHQGATGIIVKTIFH